MIDKISKGLSLSKQKEQTVLEITPSEEESTKLLRLKRGSWENAKEPWLVYDEKQKLHALLSIDTLSKMIEHFKKAEQEALFLKLEKSILQHLPLDFNDVLTVAMEEMNKSKKKDIDFNKLIKKIKKDHPNLFLDIKDLYLPEGASIISATTR
ncbi:DUF2603 domain-containing protein [Sulfurospirillum multivorans]|uniref:UPF0763 protein SMUL_0535 n=2 Tax=Sulfurospirillum multivorans TaxID=66821 RepID=A0AA86AJE2_SULMK|nr:DUF2603 domain-containing protein [Sulfurospirillum multivorans]AHJ11810.1 hypothetical protein SMUL_0535 [Sulfurospirillum multivorans DSM 12446]QEH05316.1 hypothetical protein SMN_0533 [Sulfurospirillum multivorans]